jgi:predicted nucleic acid-binding protein
MSIVIDTNVALDLLVFNDPASAPLQAALDAGELRWLATAPMRDELARVLGYPQIVPRLAFHGRTPEAVLADFDRQALRVAPAPRAPVVCKDPDDQIFIDLAVAHRAPLRSKDRAVRALRKRLAALGVEVG